MIKNKTSYRIALAFIATLVFGAAVLQVISTGPRESWTGVGTGEVSIEIPAGVNLTEVGRILAAAGVVESASFFAIATYDREEAKTIQPGRYLMALGMGSDEAIDRLLDPSSRQELTLIIPEGLRLTKAISIIAKKLEASEDEVNLVIEKLIAGDLDVQLPQYAAGSAEGFLYPATYKFPDNISIENVVVALVERFRLAETRVGLISSAESSEFSPRDILTMASLVEAEAYPADFGKVARTIRNRLNLGMPLQFDATVNYALGTSKLLFSKSEFATDSPYNTYRYPGLPPGPIGSPGEAALRAVIDPPKGDWLYFVSTDPDKGITKFTADYQEFLKFKAEFQRWYRETR